MPRAKRGEIWMADLGLAAKVRPVLVLSGAYEGQERAIVSYVIRTTGLRAPLPALQTHHHELKK